MDISRNVEWAKKKATRSSERVAEMSVRFVVTRTQSTAATRWGRDGDGDVPQNDRALCHHRNG